jgi:hypothetical protein
MEMLNKAFEDADAFKKMMEKLEDKAQATIPVEHMNRAQRRAHARSLRKKGNLNKVRS